jgi:hypothetical protein
MRLELWQYVPTGDRYVVLVGDHGIQGADGPLADAELRAIQQNITNIQLSRGCAAWITRHVRDFASVWPPQPGTSVMYPTFVSGSMECGWKDR